MMRTDCPRSTSSWRGSLIRCFEPASDLRECLLQIGDQIVNMLDADRQSNHVGPNAGLRQFLIGQLPMGGGGGVAGECFAITDVDQSRDQLQCILKTCPGVAPAVNAEIQDA